MTHYTTPGREIITFITEFHATTEDSTPSITKHAIRQTLSQFHPSKTQSASPRPVQTLAYHFLNGIPNDHFPKRFPAKFRKHFWSP